jgi:HEAT repeat protein
MLIDHPQMPVRAAAATALGQLGGQQDMGLLLLALDDPSIWVSMHAARALRAAGGEAMLRSTARSQHRRAEVAREALEEGAA